MHRCGTEETTWEKQTKQEEDVFEAEAIADFDESADAVVSSDMDAPESEVVAGEPADDTNAVSEELPEVWVEAVDPGSGQTYYYNSL